MNVPLGFVTPDGQDALAPRDNVTAIPREWRDPVQVLPHVATELRGFLGTSRAIEHDLSVVLGALDPDGQAPRHVNVREWLTSIHARLHELNHDVGRKFTVWDLIAQDLQRNGGGDANG